MQDLVSFQNGELVTTSKIVADAFGKTHRDVIRDLNNLQCSDDFRVRNFAQSSYKSRQNKTLKCVTMTRDGFSFLCMGFTGKKAAKWKEAYINAFNQMEKGLLNVDGRIQQLEKRGIEIKQAGKEWAKFGHDINRMKKEHLNECEKLIDQVQFKLDFN